jgi:DNA repair exonuclease SbcCD ATPase subunit
MSRQLLDLESVLQQLIDEHRKMLAQVDLQYDAVRFYKPREMKDIALLQESTRLRVLKLDAQRRLLTQQLAKLYKVEGELTISMLMQMFPSRAANLKKLRDELRDLMQQIKTKTQIAGRVASSVLGHLNTIVRLLAGAVERAGVYTKHGVPRVSARIGAMEAVG